MIAVRRVAAAARHVVLLEAAIWVALWRWVTRRPAVPAGATRLPYARMVTPVLWLFVWGSAIEVVALDLIVTHFGWRLVRLPHLLTDTALVLRSGLRGEVVVPLTVLTGVRAAEHELGGTIRTVEVVEGRLLVGVGGRTNLELVLAGPTELATGPGPVVTDRVGLWVDEPREVAVVLRRVLATERD